jgi:hypothetical protein
MWPLGDLDSNSLLVYPGNQCSFYNFQDPEKLDFEAITLFELKTASLMQSSHVHMTMVLFFLKKNQKQWLCEASFVLDRTALLPLHSQVFI